jgi:hypothetical protein
MILTVEVLRRELRLKKLVSVSTTTVIMSSPAATSSGVCRY